MYFCESVVSLFPSPVTFQKDLVYGMHSEITMRRAESCLPGATSSKFGGGGDVTAAV